MGLTCASPCPECPCPPPSPRFCRCSPRVRGTFAQELIGTAEGASRLWQHILGNLFTPYGTLMQSIAQPEAGSSAARWLAQQPFSLKKMVGVYEADVDCEAKKRFYEAKAKSEAKVASAMAKIEKAYVQGVASGDMNAYKLMVGQYGSTVGAKALRSLDVQKAIIVEKLKRVTDPEKRKRLKLQLEALKQRSVAEAYESTPMTQKAGLAPFYEDVFGGE